MKIDVPLLIAIGLTVAVVIAVYTYFVIRVQRQWWHERSRAQTVINASLIHEYINGVMLSNRHQEVQKFLEGLRDSGEISRGRIVKPDGAVVFSTQTQEVNRATITIPEGLFGDDRIVHGNRVENGHRFDIVMRPVGNLASCRRCHDDTKHIGAIVVERSLAPAEANITGNRNLLIMYGLLMFLLVSVVLWLLIVRLITQPIGDLLQNMRQIQAGNLNTHADVNSRDEVVPGICRLRRARVPDLTSQPEGAQVMWGDARPWPATVERGVRRCSGGQQAASSPCPRRGVTTCSARSRPIT